MAAIASASPLCAARSVGQEQRRDRADGTIDVRTMTIQPARQAQQTLVPLVTQTDFKSSRLQGSPP